jgi:hypothetical protein
MRLLLDTTGMTFTIGSDFEPVVDFETKAPKADRATGQPLAQVQLIVFFQDGQGRPRSEILTVKTPTPSPSRPAPRCGYTSWSPTPGPTTAATASPTAPPRSNRSPRPRRADPSLSTSGGRGDATARPFASPRSPAKEARP